MRLSTKNCTIPTKEVKISGFEDTITIYPIGGFALMKLKSLSEALNKDVNNAESQEECVRFALKWGCKCEDDDINFLVENDLVTCIELTKQIIEFSGEYNEAKFKESDLAKKKSKK